GSSAAIHDEHGDGGVDGAVDIAQRVLGADHAHHAETGEVDAPPGSLGDLPAEDGFLTVDLDFPIGEARTGEDIGGTGFHVVAGQAAGGKASGKRCGSGRAKHGGGTDQFHPINPSDIYYSLRGTPGTDGTASEFPAEGAGTPWQSRQSPAAAGAGVVSVCRELRASSSFLATLERSLRRSFSASYQNEAPRLSSTQVSTTPRHDCVNRSRSKHTGPLQDHSGAAFSMLVSGLPGVERSCTVPRFLDVSTRSSCAPR